MQKWPESRTVTIRHKRLDKARLCTKTIRHGHLGKARSCAGIFMHRDLYALRLLGTRAKKIFFKKLPNKIFRKSFFFQTKFISEKQILFQKNN